MNRPTSSMPFSMLDVTEGIRDRHHEARHEAAQKIVSSGPRLRDIRFPIDLDRPAEFLEHYAKEVASRLQLSSLQKEEMQALIEKFTPKEAAMAAGVLLREILAGKGEPPSDASYLKKESLRVKAMLLEWLGRQNEKSAPTDSEIQSYIREIVSAQPLSTDAPAPSPSQEEPAEGKKASTLTIQRASLHTLPDRTIVVVQAIGVLNKHTVGPFEDFLLGLIQENLVFVVLDFREVTFVSSTGLGSLVKMADRFEMAGGEMQIFGLAPKVEIVIDMLGLLTLFRTRKTLEEAMDSIAKASLSKVTFPPPRPSVPLESELPVSETLETLGKTKKEAPPLRGGRIEPAEAEKPMRGITLPPALPGAGPQAQISAPKGAPAQPPSQREEESRKTMAAPPPPPPPCVRAAAPKPLTPPPPVSPPKPAPLAPSLPLRKPATVEKKVEKKEEERLKLGEKIEAPLEPGPVLPEPAFVPPMGGAVPEEWTGAIPPEEAKIEDLKPTEGMASGVARERRETTAAMAKQKPEPDRKDKKKEEVSKDRISMAPPEKAKRKKMSLRRQEPFRDESRIEGERTRDGVREKEEMAEPEEAPRPELFSPIMEEEEESVVPEEKEEAPPPSPAEKFDDFLGKISEDRRAILTQEPAIPVEEKDKTILPEEREERESLPTVTRAGAIQPGVSLEEFLASIDDLLAEEAQKKEAPKMKRRAPSLLRILSIPFKLVWLPFQGIYYLGAWTGKKIREAWKKTAEAARNAKRKLEEKAEKEGVRVFELFLGEDAGRPGPIERFAAQSVTLMKAIQVTLGLKFILLAGAIDNALEILTGYLQGIFRSWKMMKAIQRRVKREISGTQVKGVAEDLALGRLCLSRLLGFSGFYLEEYDSPREEKEEKWDKYMGPTFALKLVLETRGHLDEMKQDLDLLTSGQVFQLVKKGMGDFLASFIPNPTDWVSPWKDLFVLAFFMRYSRREIESMYTEVLLAYWQIVETLEVKYRQEQGASYRELQQAYKTPMQHEERLLAQKDGERGLPNLVEKSRKNIQRLLYALFSPVQFLDPCRWSRFDLIREIAKMEGMGRVHPHYLLEFERWLTREVGKALKQKGVKFDRNEKERQLEEEKDFQSRYKRYKAWRETFQLI